MCAWRFRSGCQDLITRWSAEGTTEGTTEDAPARPDGASARSSPRCCWATARGRYGHSRELSCHCPVATPKPGVDIEAQALCGVDFGERSSERTNSRNGYRKREWDTRAGTLPLAIPKLRQGSYFLNWRVCEVVGCTR